MKNLELININCQCKHILLVDDEPFNIFCLETVLESVANLSTESACNG